jgi:hypothetical protein
MKELVLCVAVYAVSAMPACAECYHKEGDAAETIRDVPETGGLLWEHKGKRVEFETGSGGAGVDYRIAFDPKGKGFRYDYAGEDLIFGGVKYVKGCDE